MPPIKSIWNGKFVKPKTAKISLFSETVQWGLGVFTTMRTYNGKVFALDRHLERVFANAQAIGIEPKFDQNEVKVWIDRLLQTVKKENLRIKINIFGEGIFVHCYDLIIDEKIYQGVKCLPINSVRPYPEIKKSSYLDSILPHTEAVKKGFYDAILVDQLGFVTEGAFCNIFWFEGEQLCTRKEGVLQGVTKSVVEEISPFEIVYKKVTIEELCQMKEVFLTQSTTGIVPIVEIGENKIGDGKVGEKTTEVMKTLGEFYL